MGEHEPHGSPETLTGFLVDGPSLTDLTSPSGRVPERGIRRGGFGYWGGESSNAHPTRVVLVALIMIYIKVHRNRL